MNKYNDWHDSQNDNYLSLALERLSQPKLKWVDQFVDIINSKFPTIDDEQSRDVKIIKLNDFGCNVGHFRRGVGGINFPINYRGYDISETYLEIARNSFGFEFFENLDIAADSGDKCPRVADVSVISATLEHIEHYELALRNIFNNTRRLVVVRTFIGELSLRDSCRTTGAKSDYIIRQFTMSDIVKIPVELGWSYVEEVDAATLGVLKMTCNSTSIPRKQVVLVFSNPLMGKQYA